MTKGYVHPWPNVLKTALWWLQTGELVFKTKADEDARKMVSPSKQRIPHTQARPAPDQPKTGTFP